MYNACVLILTLTASSIGTQNEAHVAVARIASYYVLAVVGAAMSPLCALIYIWVLKGNVWWQVKHEDYPTIYII